MSLFYLLNFIGEDSLLPNRLVLHMIKEVRSRYLTLTEKFLEPFLYKAKS